MKNKNKITKTKFFLDLEKEINYINNMNKKGYKLVYIKGGCIYSFIKTKPDEYTTILYATEKEQLSQMTAFIAQYGYESVPHTMDGFGNLLYLTGKKSEVAADFINDTESKIKFNSIMKRQLSRFTNIYLAMLIIFLTCTVLLFSIAITDNLIFLYVIAGVYAVISLFYAISTAIIYKQKNRYKKRLEKIQSDSILFE